jgi:hypothetical protein
MIPTKPCPVCKGEGMEVIRSLYHEREHDGPCAYCGGRGRVPIEPEPPIRQRSNIDWLLLFVWSIILSTILFLIVKLIVGVVTGSYTDPAGG